MASKRTNEEKKTVGVNIEGQNTDKQVTSLWFRSSTLHPRVCKAGMSRVWSLRRGNHLTFEGSGVGVILKL